MKEFKSDFDQTSLYTGVDVNRAKRILCSNFCKDKTMAFEKHLHYFTFLNTDNTSS